MVDASRFGSLDRLLAGGVGTLLGAGVILDTFTNAGAVLATAGLSAVTTAVAAKVGALIISMANPITLAGMILGVLALRNHHEVALTNQVKQQVAEGVASRPQLEAHDRSISIADEVYNQTETIAAAISDGLQQEICRVREQVDAILRTKEQGDLEVERRRMEPAQLESKLRGVSNDLNKLIISL